MATDGISRSSTTGTSSICQEPSGTNFPKFAAAARIYKYWR